MAFDPQSSLPGRVARVVLRHRRVVMVMWLVVFLAGGFAAGQISNRLKFTFTLPGQPGYETAARITQLYGNGGETMPDIAVVTPPGGQSLDRAQPAINQAFDRVRAALPHARVVDLGVTGDRSFITNGGHSEYALVLTPQSGAHRAGSAGPTAGWSPPRPAGLPPRRLRRSADWQPA